MIQISKKVVLNVLSFILLLLTLKLFAAILNEGPMIANDTLSYVNCSAFRPFFYPLVLKLNALINGDNNYSNLVLFQNFLGFAAAEFTARKFMHFFDLNRIQKWALFIVLLAPYYISFHNVGNLILTEAIAYPLFLMAIYFLFEGIINKKTRSLIYFTLLLSLLIFVRRQFLFLYPVYSLLLLYLFRYERRCFRVGLLVVIFILCGIATNLVERTWQYTHNGHFTTIPFTGLQIVVAPLYVSKDSDSMYFKDDLQKSIFLKVRDVMHQQKLCLDDQKNATLSTEVYFQYLYSFNQIARYILVPEVDKQLKGSLVALDINKDIDAFDWPKNR